MKSITMIFLCLFFSFGAAADLKKVIVSVHSFEETTVALDEVNGLIVDQNIQMSAMNQRIEELTEQVNDLMSKLEKSTPNRLQKRPVLKAERSILFTK